jgi:M6 family metalloprotease-like protein
MFSLRNDGKSTMRKPYTIVMSLVVLALATGYPRLFAMPPYPGLTDRMSTQIAPTPYYLEHEAELRDQGVEAPYQIPNMHRTRPRHTLDENFKIIILFLDFTTKVHQTAASNYDSLFYGNSTGSLKDFISEVTYGNVTLVTMDMPGALGWLRAPQTYAYYVNAQNGFGTYPHNAQKMVEDAVTLADPLVDFSNYDNDGDGYVDALFVVHSGPGAEYTGSNNDIWSHAWGTHAPMAVDGDTVWVYSTEPEYWVTHGDMTCGVFAHEMGHAAFGLPDLYDTDYGSQGIGRWSLMASGSWNGTLGNSPAHPDVWSKIQMGVLTPTDVLASSLGASLPAVEISPTAYRIYPDGVFGQQYVLVENRQYSGYDVGLPGHGLVIYHIDDAVTSNDNQWYPGHAGGHYHVAVEQADGLWEMEHNLGRGNAGDSYPGGTNNRTYDDMSTPNSRDYAGVSTGIAVRNISACADTMTADLYGSLPRSFTLSVPDGGQTWYVGDADTVRWTSNAITGNVAIDVNRSYPTGTWSSVTTSAVNNGRYRWVVPAGASTSARIRIRSLNFPAIGDTSAADLTLAQRTITLTAPTAGAIWLVGDSHDITWTSQNLTENVKIEINRTYPTGTWSTLVASTPNAGSYAWTVSGSASTTARIRITGVTHTAATGTSAANFSVGARTITITSPNTAAVWIAGDTNTVTWTTSNLPEFVKIELNRTYPAGTWESVADSIANSGSCRWAVSTPLTTTARIRIKGTSHTTVGDTSNVNFSIGRRSLTVTSPNTNLNCIIPGTDSIRWTSLNLAENVKIELDRDYPSATWEIVAASVTNNGLYRWAVGGAEAANARIRISGVTHPAICDTSDQDFSIVAGQISATVSQAPGPFLIGDQLSVMTTSNLTENLRVELKRTYPAGTWTSLATNASANGTYSWTVTGPVSETACIRVSGMTHSGVIDTCELFSIHARTLTLTTPNSALTWAVGDTDSIRWNSANMTENVKLELKRAWPAGAWETIAADVPNTGSYGWVLSGAATSTARIRITGVTHATVGDTSNANFVISRRAIHVTFPNTAVTCLVGGIDTIRWTSACMSESLRIEINREHPTGSWDTLAASVPNTGSYRWLVSAPATTTARLRITGLVHGSISDSSDVNFSVLVPQITLTTPVGGESWYVGDADTIRWTATNITENVKIELNRSFPTEAWTTLASSVANSGAYRWVVTAGNSTSAKIRVSAVSHTFVRDSSSAAFTIAARSISVTSPNTAVTWLIGDSCNITWTSQNLTEDVRIEINRAYSTGAWTTLVASTPNTGSYLWAVNGPATGTCRVRVKGTAHTSISGISAANFAVRARTITVTAPNTSIVWVIGTARSVTWTSANLTEAVTIELNRTYPAGTWENISDSTANDGSFSWTVTEPVTTTARVRVKGLTHRAVGDTSNVNFSIQITGMPQNPDSVDGSIGAAMPRNFYLAQNYPNPFNPATTIVFGLAASGQVRIDIFNLTGQRVAELLNEFVEPGEHRVSFNGSQLPSGVYLCRLRSGTSVAQRKMVLMK